MRDPLDGILSDLVSAVTSELDDVRLWLAPEAQHGAVCARRDARALAEKTNLVTSLESHQDHCPTLPDDYQSLTTLFAIIRPRD